MGLGQIVKRKRKGRPPKSDPSSTALSPSPPSSTSSRRTLRRGNVRYSSFIDYDDFLERDGDDGAASEEEDEESKSKRKRKNTGWKDDDDDEMEDDKEDSGWKGNSKGHESPPGTPPHSSSNVPLPDKMTLELILDKLQK